MKLGTWARIVVSRFLWWNPIPPRRGWYLKAINMCHCHWLIWLFHDLASNLCREELRIHQCINVWIEAKYYEHYFDLHLIEWVMGLIAWFGSSGLWKSNFAVRCCSGSRLSYRSRGFARAKSMWRATTECLFSAFLGILLPGHLCGTSGVSFRSIALTTIFSSS